VNASSEVKQIQMKIEHLSRESKEKHEALQTTGKEYHEMMDQMNVTEKDIKQLQHSLSSLNFDEAAEQDLLHSQKNEESILRDLREKLDSLSVQLSSLQFTYSDPEKSFDRSKVKGLVANLIEVKDSNTSIALEVTAGGRLYNVVVDTEETGKQLLKNGQLKKRVTIIPLNKINKRTVDSKIIKNAERLVGPENVTLALSLVGYDEEVRSAMEFVFGSTFICKDSEIAKQLTFNPEIKVKTVTLEGDLFDPSGTLTGGSRQANRSILDQVRQINELRNQVSVHEKELSRIVQCLTNLKKLSEQYKLLKQKYDLKVHELELLQARISSNSHHQQINKKKELELQLESAKTTLEILKQKEFEANQKCKELEGKMKNFSNTRDSQLKSLETSVKQLKEKHNTSQKELKNRQHDKEQISLEIGELNSEMASIGEQLRSVEVTISRMKKQVNEKAEIASNKKTEYDTVQFELDQKKKDLLACDFSLSQLSTEKERVSREISDISIELKRIEHKLETIHKEKKDAVKLVEHLEQKYPWIANEKQYFGKSHSDYDFTARNPTESQKELTKLQGEQARLSKQINKKVMSMFEKAEQEYNELLHKKQIIEKDKQKIEAVIRELDDKKNEALNSTWIKVNRDFGSIFSTLLPGTKAKLEPPEGKTVLDGLEMKVAFGEAWKESLSELSGGQKSLLALSLILALLLFKPAPMYILDEIDAALDLSHTQNIGQMLKTHFSQSQFIIVSLKEDMFRNANVLFR